jgi:hypothetical protein
MKTITERLRRLELRRIEQTPQVIPDYWKRKLLEKVKAIQECREAARVPGELVPTYDSREVMAAFRIRTAHYRKGAESE